MIFKIVNNRAYKVSLSNEITEEEYIKKFGKNDVIQVDHAPDSSYLKYENGELIEDIEYLNNLKIESVKNHCLYLLEETDRFMLIDNPGELNDEEMAELTELRKTWRLYSVDAEGATLPEIPQFLIDRGF